MTGVLRLRNGDTVPWEDLYSYLPSEYFATDTHRKVCESLATPERMPADLLPVYVNLLFAQSRVARRLTVLVTLLNMGSLDPDQVLKAPLLSCVVHLVEPSLEKNISETQAVDLVDTAYIRRFLLKAIIHRIFRLFRHRHLRSAAVIRTWVDATDLAYPDQVDSATLLIYPFSDSVPRQIRYLAQCMRRKRSFSLAGLPYRFRDLWRLMRQSPDSDRAIVAAATHAFDRHALDFVEMGTETLYTTDEFDWAGIRLHSLLAKHGIRCFNTSHSVEVYGPNVAYAHFRFYNERQRIYYARKGGYDASSIRVHRLPNDGDCAGGSPARELGVIIVDSNWSRKKYPYEARFQQIAMKRAIAICQTLGILISVKLHPNVPASKKNRYLEMGVDSIIDRLDTSLGFRPVYLNVKSTVYYECLGYGPTIFLCDDWLRQDWLFGDGIFRVRLEDLDSELSRLRNTKYWEDCYRDQVAIERRAQ